jgi:methylenetetrahydrofolate dehydrogenase (NADP+)/methenyltetrahydrofolate cyclohydrolase
MIDDRVLDGARIAAEVRSEVEAEVSRLGANGVTPRLDVVLVGEDPASKVYVGSKGRACAKLGMESETHHLAEEASQAEVEGLVDRLNDAPEVDGILVQLPLPGHLDAHAVVDRIDPAKDVDGLHPCNVGLLQEGRPHLVPCTPAGIMEMLGRSGVELEGRRAVVVGRSDLVGKPLAMLLLHAHATVTLCHSRTRPLEEVTRQADVLVAAAGRMALIGPEHVGDGAVVVDVGIHRVTERETALRLFPDNAERLEKFNRKGSILVGDVDFARVAPKAGRITPVPGGVGPLTIAMLLSNTVRAATARRGMPGG